MPPLPRLAALLPLLALLLAACGHAPNGATDPMRAADDFFAHVEKGETRPAYESAAFRFQAVQALEAFSSNCQELGFVGGRPPQWGVPVINGDDASLTGTLVGREGNAIALRLKLLREAGAWKLFDLGVGDAPRAATAEGDIFLMVGKGTGFSDVHEQPIPDTKHIVSLVQGTIDLFARAIKAKDFHEFYVAISQRWKELETGERGTGVTENMLMTHFKGFMDQKIDLTPCAQLEPVFDSPPLIDEAGVLEVKGHFEMPPYRVIFFLEYTYELPRWKLFGIDVQVAR